MHCFQVRRLLDEYRDGELRGSQRSAWETHLRSCARCSALRRGREDVSALPRRWEDARSSDELTARVVIAWQAPWPQECQRVHRRSVAARAAVGAAALVSVAVFAGVRVVAAAREVSAPPAGADRIHGPFGRASGPDAWDAGRRELGG